VRIKTLAQTIKSLAEIIKRARPATAILNIAGWFLPGPRSWVLLFLAPLGTIRAGLFHCPGSDRRAHAEYSSARRPT
jgi:hypothetical protein